MDCEVHKQPRRTSFVQIHGISSYTFANIARFGCVQARFDLARPTRRHDVHAPSERGSKSADIHPSIFRPLEKKLPASCWILCRGLDSSCEVSCDETHPRWTRMDAWTFVRVAVWWDRNRHEACDEMIHGDGRETQQIVSNPTLSCA